MEQDHHQKKCKTIRTPYETTWRDACWTSHVRIWKAPKSAPKFTWKINIENDLSQLGIDKNAAAETGDCWGTEAVEGHSEVDGCWLKNRSQPDDTVPEEEVTKNPRNSRWGCSSLHSGFAISCNWNRKSLSNCETQNCRVNAIWKSWLEDPPDCHWSVNQLLYLGRSKSFLNLHPQTRIYFKLFTR